MSDEGSNPPPIPPRPPAPPWVGPPAPHPQQWATPGSQPAWPDPAPQPAWPAPAPQPAWPAATPQPPTQQPVPQQAPWPVAPQQAGPFAAPYAAAPRGSFVEPIERRSRVLGVTALVLALLATVGASIVGAVAAWQMGQGADLTSFSSPQGPTDLGFLSPVRDWVLLGEVAFWAGTVLGIWAIIQGIVAIARRRGRAAAIVAVVIAAIGPLVFFVAVAIAFAAVLDTGSLLGV